MRNASLLLALLFCAGAARAAEDETPELFTRVEHYHADYVVNDDASAVTTVRWAVKVLKEAAVAGAKKASISYSTSIEKAEVLEAYTMKPDGHRIDSPPSNFQVEVNSGKDQGAPVFSDRTNLTVVFPEVAVGDTVVFAYRLTQSEPMFPKHFSLMESFQPTAAYDDVQISLDAPTALSIQQDVRGMTLTADREQKGRRYQQWHFENRQPVKSVRRNYSVYDSGKDPGYAFSTFKTYAEIAAAYGERARPKAVVTARVQKLADETVTGSVGAREQAKALYDWVARNITYAGNCIGIGAVVPHDIDFVLDNRMGDCKDHATLLQALLKARGIDSTQALVNAGNGYRLPKLPVVSQVNHVINFVPSLKLYLDSTASTSPFGLLPFSSADKPVLLVDGFVDGARTPAYPAGTNRQDLDMSLKIHADGSASGTMKVQLKGLYAIDIKSAFSNVPKDRQGELVENVFRSQGLNGSGSYQTDDPMALTDNFRYEATFEIKNLIPLPGAGAFNVYPPFINPAPVSKYMVAANERVEAVDVACGGGFSEENYRIELPPTMKVLALPDNAKLDSEVASYSASYRRKGNVLTVKRVFDDRTPGNVCSPQLMTSYKAFVTKVLPNLKSQIVYR